MYRALLRAQWNSNAVLVMFLSLIAFGLPLVQLLITAVAGSTGSPEDAAGMLAVLGESSGAFPLIAYSSGGLMALGCWQDDTQAKHVYALSLPVPRWYYLLLRMSVGFTLLAIPVVALWIASMIAISQLTLPPGLHAYPAGLAVRFGLAAAFSFAAAFAFGSTSQRVLRNFLWVFGAIVVILILMAVTGMTAPLEQFFSALFKWPGFIDIFTGRWLLIDV